MSEPLEPFAARAEQLLCRVFRGMHHVYSLKKCGNYWTCLHQGTLATYDFDTLTRLVLAAHDYALRVEIAAAGPRRLKICVFERVREGEWHQIHPGIEQALEKWRTAR